MGPHGPGWRGQAALGELSSYCPSRVTLALAWRGSSETLTGVVAREARLRALTELTL